MSADATHQWRGVIEEYRDLLDLPEGLEAVTLREGGTPLVHSEWLSGLTGARGLAQGRGRQPDRLLQGPRHDRGHLASPSTAGAEAVVCASTGNTSASMAAYAAKAGLKPLVLIPEGKIAAGKIAQAVVHGAQVIMVRGNFDDCLAMAHRACPRTTPSRWSTRSTRCASRARRRRRSRSSTSSATPPTSTCCRSATPATSRPTGSATSSTPSSAAPRSGRGCAASRPRARRRW